MAAAIAFVVCILGLLFFLISKDDQHRQVGKIMFWTGLLAFLLNLNTLLIHWRT